MKYTIQITCTTCADTIQEAYLNIQHALKNAKKAEIIHLDSEVVESTSEFLDDGYSMEDYIEPDARD